jgi:hypothetical protein
MNESEFDLVARAWLDDGPSRMSDRALLSALEEVHTTRQRRTRWPAWRATPASIFIRVGVGAGLAVAVGLLAINLVPRQPDRSSIGGGSASPSPARSVDIPDLTETFVSPRNGFSVRHPDRVALTPAKQLWGLSKQIDDGFDVMETGLGTVVRGGSMELPFRYGFVASSEWPSIDEWVDSMTEDLPGGCGVPRSQQVEISIDGRSGRISECPDGIVATVVAGARLYLFTLLDDRSDARAVFDAFAATIDLTPETAVNIPNLTSTFVSPTNGFSFGYLDRGGLKPATELWDPVTQPRPDSSGAHDAPFDGVETGLGAYFKSASTEIPDGVSIDAWVDDHVSPGGCVALRSRQAEITIDGRAGRIAECPNEIEATVVAGDRLYLFILLHHRSDARAFFDAWVATIDLRPEDAAAASSTPS